MRVDSMILVLVFTSLVESQYFRLWHNENREGVVVWGEVQKLLRPCSLHFAIAKNVLAAPRFVTV